MAYWLYKSEPSVWSWDDQVAANVASLMEKGKQIFRDDTFGSEHFWGGKLRLHDAIKGAARGGIGPGLTARQALQLGLRVDAGRLDGDLIEAMEIEEVRQTL